MNVRLILKMKLFKDVTQKPDKTGIKKYFAREKRWGTRRQGQSIAALLGAVVATTARACLEGRSSVVSPNALDQGISTVLE